MRTTSRPSAYAPDLISGLPLGRPPALCERDAAADPLDDVWATIRREGVESAERDGISAEDLLGRVRKSDKLGRLREELAARQAIDLLVREAKPISVEAAEEREAQARAREKIWTPGQEEAPSGAAEGSSAGAEAAESAPKIWTPGS